MQQHYDTTNTEKTNTVGECCQQHCNNVVNNSLPKILQNKKYIILDTDNTGKGR